MYVCMYVWMDVYALHVHALHVHALRAYESIVRKDSLLRTDGECMHSPRDAASQRIYINTCMDGTHCTSTRACMDRILHRHVHGCTL